MCCRCEQSLLVLSVLHQFNLDPVRINKINVTPRSVGVVRRRLDTKRTESLERGVHVSNNKPKMVKAGDGRIKGWWMVRHRVFGSLKQGQVMTLRTDVRSIAAGGILSTPADISFKELTVEFYGSLQVADGHVHML